MKIHVTQEHIVHGIKTSAKDCAVALAIRQAANIDWCCVSPYYASVWHQRDMVKLSLPPQVYEFVITFDSGAPVQPFVFELAYPETPPTFWQTLKKRLSDWWNTKTEPCPMCDGAGQITVAEKPQQKELCHDLALTK